MSMKHRLRAAWRVLRGEWTARPPVAASHFDHVNVAAYTNVPTTGSTTTTYTDDWKVGL